MLCQNEGVCVQEAGKPIRCKCPPMFTGETCQINKCQNNPCKNNSTCIPVDREPGFVCKCADGLTGPLCSREYLFHVSRVGVIVAKYDGIGWDSIGWHGMG